MAANLRSSAVSVAIAESIIVQSVPLLVEKKELLRRPKGSEGCERVEKVIPFSNEGLNGFREKREGREVDSATSSPEVTD